MNRTQIKRSTKPMKRSNFRIKVEQEKTSRPRRSEWRGSRRTKLKVVGRRTADWRKVWRFLKPRLEAAGRIYCEFDFIWHLCCGILDPVHSKKRRMMQGNDIYAVAVGCRNIHDHLDMECTHAEMEALVMEAIERHGGLILPERKAA